MCNSVGELPDNEHVFEGSVDTKDRVVEVGCAGLLLLFGYTWIRYGLNMLFAIVPVLLCAVYIGMYSLTPQRYVFTEKELIILHKYSRTQHIAYSDVFNIDSRKHDNMLNVTSDNAVKLYYEVNGKKRTAACSPSYVDGFVAAVKKNCPVFWDKEED